MSDTLTIADPKWQKIIKNRLEALSPTYLRKIIQHLQEWQNVAMICKRKPSQNYIKYATKARTEYIPALIKEVERLKAEVKDLKEPAEC